MTDKEWFKEWFDSPYYYLLYANRTQEEASNFINRIAEKLQMPAHCMVLDVACGKGRHSLTLANKGFDVTGIDLSPHSIEYAKEFECKNLHFEVWDMRQPYKPGQFDYVFNLFSSFGYFDSDDDDKKAIQSFADNLKPGGTLLIDYINPECAVMQMKSRDIVPRGDIQFHIQKRVENNFIKKKIEFLADGQHYSFEEQLKIINLFKFKTLLAETNFELKSTYGNYDLSDFNPHSSQRLIMVATKK
jgi:SAM-dependent methyltransferase